MKILSGNADKASRALSVIDLWDNRLRHIKLDNLGDRSSCPACSKTDLPWLQGIRGDSSAVLCGRDSVQLSFPEQGELDLEAIEAELSNLGKVKRNKFLLKFYVDDFVISLFKDGRAIVGGTEDVAVAKTVYAKYIGN